MFLMRKPLSELLHIHYPNKAKTNEAFSFLQDGDFIAGGCALYAIALKALEPALEIVILKSVSGPEHCIFLDPVRCPCCARSEARELAKLPFKV